MLFEMETRARPETKVRRRVKKSKEVSPPLCSKMSWTPCSEKTSRVALGTAPKVEAKEPKKVAFAYKRLQEARGRVWEGLGRSCKVGWPRAERR